MYRKLVLFTLLATFALLMLGAYVRLTDAGLGCPDWPGCYGKISPLHASEQIGKAVEAQGGDHGPVSMGKAWREMGHRYVAKLVGLACIVIAVLAWRGRQTLKQTPWLAFAVLAVVIVQGLFGMWTVTLKLMPIVVTGHLLGGMLTFALLVWLWQRQVVLPRYRDAEPFAALRPPLLIGLALLVVQIFLGGWTSTNYAALACPDLPLCQGRLWPPTDFSHALDFTRSLGMTDAGTPVPFPVLTAIHLMHRIGAIVVFGYLFWLGTRVARTEGAGGLGVLLLVAVSGQFLLGLSNVFFALPLAVAVAHNGGAALLLATMVVLNFRAFRARFQV